MVLKFLSDVSLTFAAAAADAYDRMWFFDLKLSLCSLSPIFATVLIPCKLLNFSSISCLTFVCIELSPQLNFFQSSSTITNNISILHRDDLAKIIELIYFLI